MKRKVIIIGSAMGILFISIALSMLFSSQKEAPKIRKPVVKIKYVKTKGVEYKPVKTYVVAYGRVETAQLLDLLSEVSGRMFEGEIPLEEGEFFTKGTLLFYVDDRESALNLKAQKSNFLKDLASILPDLQLDYRNNYSVWENYFNSLNIDKKFPKLPLTVSLKEKIFLSTKGIYSSFYTIKSAEIKVQKHKYYAPFDGSISEMLIESGSFVNSGTRIGRIIQTGVYELKVSVSSRDIAWIQKYAPVVISSEETQKVWKGEVVRMSDFVDQNTQSVNVFISIFPNQDKIYDGQFLQASIPAQIVEHGMVIPRSALYNGNEIFAVENDTLLKVKQVNVVRLTEEDVIFDGLKAGSDVVVEPLISAYNNMIVQKQSVIDTLISEEKIIKNENDIVPSTIQ